MIPIEGGILLKKHVSYFHSDNLRNVKSVILLKGAEATYVEITTEMKKCFRLKDMLNFNVL